MKTPGAPTELLADLQGGQWQWYTFWGFDLVNSWMQARRTFDLAKIPKQAELLVTADTSYTLFVNGQYVHQGPARGFQDSWPVDRVDVAPYLRRGRNVIAALVHQIGLSTFSYVHKDFAGFLLAGRIGGVDVSSGPSWQTRGGPGYRRHTRRLSVQLGFQEHFDARLDDGTWKTLKPPRDGWKKESACAKVGTMPWPAFEERGIPVLTAGLRYPVAIRAQSEGKCRDGWESVEDVFGLAWGEQSRWNERQLPALADAGAAGWAWRIPAAGRDRYTGYVLDFGTEVVGAPMVTVEGGAGGEAVDLVAFEEMRGGQPVLGDPELGCKVAMGGRLIARPGRTRHEFFTSWGLRYLLVIVRGARRPLRVSLAFRERRYPLELKGQFECSDEGLNQIRAISVRAQECCALDAFVDCPWREQAQWWGDARVQAANTHYLSGDSRLLVRGIRQIGTQKVPNGLTYGHAPTMAHHCILPDFSLTWVLTHWDYYWQTADLGLFRDLCGRVDEVLRYFEGMTAANGLLPYDPRYWLFMDWCPFSKEGYPTVYNLLYLWSLRVAASLNRKINRTAQAVVYARRERSLRRAILGGLYDARRQAWLEGLTPRGKPIRRDIPHANALAILLDLVPESHVALLDRSLLPLVRGHREQEMVPSPFFMHYIFEALKKTGHECEVLDCIRLWWGEFVTSGLAATPEGWGFGGGQGFGSLCHAWSAHPIVHFANILLGVRQVAPGWSAIRLAPRFAGLDWARGSVPTPRGLIETGWKRTGQTAQVTCRVPAGMRLSVQWPGRQANAIGHGGHRMMWLVQSEST